MVIHFLNNLNDGTGTILSVIDNISICANMPFYDIFKNLKMAVRSSELYLKTLKCPL